MVTMTQNVSVGATFTQIYYTLTVSTSGQGTVTSTDGFISCPGNCSHSYPSNTPVTLNANPASGWILSGWSGACSGTGSCNVTMTQAQSVSAAFIQASYLLTVLIAGDGTVTSTDGFINCPGTCSHSYLSGTKVTLNATLAQGWNFTGWSGACSGTGSCMVTMTQPESVTAIFTGTGALQFVPVTPCRLVDTRNTGGAIQGGNSRDFPVPQEGGCNIPDTAAAYSLNVTVVPSGPLGFLTIWPTGESRPGTSLLNSYDGRVKANAAIVKSGNQGEVSVFVTNTSNVLLDIDGYSVLASNSTLAFYPLPPCRVADTRNPVGHLGGPYLKGDVERDFPVLESMCSGLPTDGSAKAYSLNFTAVPHGPLGFLTVWPNGQTRPTVSTLNSYSGQVVANAAIVPAGTGGEIGTFASNDTDLVIDIDGYFAAPGQGGLSMYSAGLKSVPCRDWDTRFEGNGQPFSGELTVDVLASCGVPSVAQAYVFNATVVPSGSLGFLTVWPDGSTQPLVSTLNAGDGAVTSNMAIVPAGDKGKIDAYAAGLTQLLLDISSYFAP